MGITFHSNHGSLEVDRRTGEILKRNYPNGNGDYLESIAKFDIERFNRINNNVKYDNVDILSCSFWDISGEYIEAEQDYEPICNTQKKLKAKFEQK